MADEQKRDDNTTPDERPSAGDAGSADWTAQLPPSGRELPADPWADSAETSVLPPPSGTGGDATVKLPPNSPARPPAMAAPGTDATSVLSSSAEAWSGRAGVPDGPTDVRDAQPSDAAEPDDEGRSWWGPILIGVLALILLGIVAIGLWLALRDNKPAPLPITSPSPVVTTFAPSPSVAASPSPGPTASAFVPVPAGLIGLTQQDAIRVLGAAGLNPRIAYRTDDAEAGTVLEVQPSIGSIVAPGSSVTIVVAIAAPASPSPSPSLSPSPSPAPSESASPSPTT